MDGGREGGEGGREGGREVETEGGREGGREGGKLCLLFIEGFNNDSVPQIISDCCTLFRISMSAAFFLFIWQLIRICILCCDLY